MWKPSRFKTPTIGHHSQHWHYPIYLLPALLVWLLSTWLAFDYGRGRAGYDSGEAEDRLDEMRAEIRVMDKEREQLKREIASLESKLKIAESVERDLKDTLISSQDERLALKKDILFLRGVISGDTSSAVLKIQDFTVSRESENDPYRLRFSIHQSAAGKTRVEGTLTISLSGVDLLGQKRTLALEDLAVKEMQGKLGFWHFQKVEESFRLPDGFRPDRWQVELKPSTEGYEAVQEQFDWE